MINKNELQQLIKYSKTLNLLYVEDSLEAREQALKLLNNFFTNITVAVNGQDGVDKFNDGKSFDLIITDLNMPVMCGTDMIKNIRLINTNIPIFVLSAHNESNFKDNLKNYNPDKFIIKPASLDDFIEIIKLLKEKYNHD